MGKETPNRVTHQVTHVGATHPGILQNPTQLGTQLPNRVALEQPNVTCG